MLQALGNLCNHAFCSWDLEDLLPICLKFISRDKKQLKGEVLLWLRVWVTALYTVEVPGQDCEGACFCTCSQDTAINACGRLNMLCPREWHC